jgi:hypothetical protein
MAVAKAGWMRGIAWIAAAAVAATGCVDEIDPEGAEEDLGAVDGKADSATLPLRFLPGELFLPSALIQTERREVFRTEAELEERLQIDNPGIDFDHEWAVLYAAGNTNPDLVAGAMARIDTVSLSSTGLTLKVTTALEKNGAGCPTRRTRPFLLVAIPIPDEPPPYTRMVRADRTRVCSADAYFDGVAFTAAQAAGALRACNQATSAQLGGAGITGSPRSILLGGRTWGTLGLVSSTAGIGPATMEKLRTLSSSF